RARSLDHALSLELDALVGVVKGLPGVVLALEDRARPLPAHEGGRQVPPAAEPPAREPLEEAERPVDVPGDVRRHRGRLEACIARAMDDGLDRRAEAPPLRAREAAVRHGEVALEDVEVRARRCVAERRDDALDRRDAVRGAREGQDVAPGGEEPLDDLTPD